MKNIKTILSLIVICTFIFSLVGCGQSADNKAPATTEQKAAESAKPSDSGEKKDDSSNKGGDFESKQWLIGLSQEGLDHPFMITQRKQVQEAAAKYKNVKIIATDGQNNVAKQVAGIEDMIAQGANILLIQASKAEGLKQELEKVSQAKIPFLFVGKPIKGTAAVTMVSMDNAAIGKQVGEYIVETLKKKNGSPKGNVVLMEGIPGDQTSEDRINAAKEVLKANPDIKIVAQVAGDYRRPKAFSVMQDVLQKNPKGTIDFVYPCNGEMALGVLQALKDAGRTNEMPVVGLDGQKEEFDAIKAGELTATWKYKPCGTEGLEYAIKILKGEKVDPVIIVPSEMITKDNVANAEVAF